MIHMCHECRKYCLLNDNAYNGLKYDVKFCPMNGKPVHWIPFKQSEKIKSEKNDKIDYNLMIDRLDTIIDLLNEKLD